MLQAQQHNGQGASLKSTACIMSDTSQYSGLLQSQLNALGKLNLLFIAHAKQVSGTTKNKKAS